MSSNGIMTVKLEKLLPDQNGPNDNRAEGKDRVLVVPAYRSQDETKSADNHYMLGCVEDSIELVVQWQAKQHTRTRMRFKQRSNFSEAMNVFKRLGLQWKLLKRPAPRQSQSRQSSAFLRPSPSPLSSSVWGPDDAADDFQASERDLQYIQRPLSVQPMAQRASSVYMERPTSFSQGFEHELESTAMHGTYRPNTVLPSFASSRDPFIRPPPPRRAASVFPSQNTMRHASPAPPDMLQSWHFDSPRHGTRAEQKYTGGASLEHRYPAPSSQERLPPQRTLPFPAAKRARLRAPEPIEDPDSISLPEKEASKGVKETDFSGHATPQTSNQRTSTPSEQRNRRVYELRGRAKHDEAYDLQYKSTPDSSIIGVSPKPAATSQNPVRRKVVPFRAQPEVDLGNLEPDSPIVSNTPGTNGREGTNSSSNATRDMSHRDKQNSQQDKHTESSKSRIEHASDGGEIATRSNTSTWDIARPSAPPRQQASQSAPQKSQALSKAEQDEQFVARLKLLWDVRHVHEDIKRQIYQSPEAERQQLYKQKMEVLHQQVVELTQAALSRHGPSVCDLPYEKMEALFMRGK
ncbi:hypothetical protein C8034_v002535 [Colletotrichum sidae]|uniref:Uncharacterized protein n=1 Tax=Colletotrichum sidae TaxID=1347389 RepID=A0A4R8TR26_9PEZI|nr:hypothetical protein C8034_v002535 [Colletotrichum sidae]